MSRIRKLLLGVVIAVATLFAGVTPAKADFIDLTLTFGHSGPPVGGFPFPDGIRGVASNDEFGNPINISALFDLSGNGILPGSSLVGIGWDVHLYADFPSYLSEIAIAFGLSQSNITFYANPGYTDDTWGFGDYFSPVIDLVGLGFDIYLPTGQLYVELFELYDDYNLDWDGIWLEGSTITLRFDVPSVPVPGGIVMAGIGVLSLGAFSRLRRRKLQAA